MDKAKPLPLPTAESIIAELGIGHEFDLEDTEKANKASTKRLALDIPINDWDQFFRESRNRQMSMRRYFYQVWDHYTKDTRTEAVFPGGRDEKTPSPVTNANLQERGDTQRLAVTMPFSDWSDYTLEAHTHGYTLRRYFYFLWDHYTGKKRIRTLVGR